MKLRLTIALSCATIGAGSIVGLSAEVPAAEQQADGESQPGAECGWPPREFPDPDQVRSAAEFSEARGVAFAVIDGCSGLRGYEQDRHFSSASITKALLLAAFLDEHPDPTESERSTLESMITFSDNDAGDAIYAEVGDEGLTEVAERAGMSDFEPDPGFWGGAQVTAADMARFFFRLDHNLAGPQREFGERLLASVTETQQWGIPAVAGSDWRVWLKGGWRPAGQEDTTGPVTHQAALLEHGSGERVAIAVLSNDAPGSTSYAAIEGIAKRLLTPPPRPRIWIAA